ncbi:MAG: M10 family metallopeptidase C-terminal domain-containing protein [Novosphingobium sp.]
MPEAMTTIEGDPPVQAPVPDLADTVPGDTTTTAVVPVGGAITVDIDGMLDRDWFRVTLQAGQSYVISTIISGTLSDTQLRLYNTAGNFVRSNDDAASGLAFSEIRFTAPSSGTYFIEVFGTGLLTGTTTLTVTAPTADGIAGTTATTGVLALGTPIDSTISATGDHDWYALTLTAGTTYVLNTSATGGFDADTTLMLRNSSGDLLRYNDDTVGTYSQIVFTAGYSGTYYLDVGAYANSGTGAYRVAAVVAPALQVYTNDQIAYQLTNTYWGGTTRHWDVTAGGTITVNLTGLTADGQTLAREALGLWTDATGIAFSEVASGGQILFDDDQADAFTTTTRAGDIITGAAVNISTAWLTTYGTTLRSYSFQTYVHEIGHALGLGHGGNYNGEASFPLDASYLNDAWVTTVMSYFDQAENYYFAGQGFTRQFVVSPMLADLIAVGNLYGATATRTGNTTYGFDNSSGRAIYTAVAGQTAMSYTIVDSGGIDTLNYSLYTQNQRIDLNAEAFSNIGGAVGNVSIARGTLIENAVGGSGNDVVIGNAADNTLTGLGGLNQIYGGGGNDTINAIGSDVVYGEDGNDTVHITGGGSGGSFDGGAGTDVLYIDSNVTGLGALSGFESLVLASNWLTLTSTQVTNWLSGTMPVSGSGILFVDMDPGVLLFGSALNIVPGSGILLYVRGSTETDVVKARLDLGSWIFGNEGADQLRGSNLSDLIEGGDGNDKIMGLAGGDSLSGGAGIDQFRYLFANDSTVEAADVIQDFVIGEDRLDFRVLDADLLTPGRQTLTLIGNAAFSTNGIAQVRFADVDADLLVEVDLNGDGAADMQIWLAGLAGQSLTGTDFLF